MDARDWNVGTRTFAWRQHKTGGWTGPLAGSWYMVERKFTLPSFASDAPTWYHHPRSDRGRKVGGPTVNQ
jgi:hypothetical protein